MTDVKSRAEARLEAALEGADRQDPREHYRRALRALKGGGSAAFDEALRYYEEELVPAVAGEADPLEAWAEYGMVLARALGPGRAMELDSTGRARPVDDPASASGLVLFLPDDDATPAFVLRSPKLPSPAQRASRELLVEGRRTASAYAG